MRSRVYQFFLFLYSKTRADTDTRILMKKNGTRKATKRRRRPARRKPSNLADRIKRMENLVGKTIENKVVDYQATAVNGEQIYAASPVTKLAFFRMEGTGPNDDDRIGDKVTLMSQRFMFGLTKGSGAQNDQRVRVLIVENIGYDPATDLELTDVLEYGSWATDNVTVFTSPYKLGADATKRYRVLFDQVYSLHETRYYVKIDFTHRYGSKTNPGKVLNYELSTADFPNNHRICAFAISDYATGTAPPTITMLSRSKYKDA